MNKGNLIKVVAIIIFGILGYINAKAGGTVTPIPAVDKGLFKMINDYRAGNGLDTLRWAFYQETCKDNQTAWVKKITGDENTQVIKAELIQIVIEGKVSYTIENLFQAINKSLLFKSGTIGSVSVYSTGNKTHYITINIW